MRNFELFVALRYLKSKRKELFISIITVISVVGVAVSVMVLNVVLAVMTGFEVELQSKLIDANAHVTIRRFGGELDDYQRALDIIRKTDGVTSAYPYTYNQAMVSTEFGARGVLIRGIADDPVPRAKLDKLLTRGLTSEVLFSPAEISVLRPDGSEDLVKLPPLVVGKALQDRLNLRSGTPVTILAPEFKASPHGLIPKLRRFVTMGTYHSGLVEYESGLAYASLRDAQAFFSLGDSVSGIEIAVDDLFAAKQIGQRIITALGGNESPYYATDWSEQNKPLWDAIKLEKRVYFVVLCLLILVASFSIVSTLVMVVMEKSKDIAILKSMGASDSSVLKVFFLQGTIIGVLGVLIGTLCGYLGCIGLRAWGWEIDQSVFGMDTVPVNMVLGNFVLVAVSAFFITSLAGVYPALRAARLRPADALRFE